MRIANMINLIGKIAGSSIEVNQERCVLVRNRNADCLRCADACVSGCISYQDGELCISPFECVGCSTCATVCPTAALEAKSPTDYDLLLSCEKAAARNDGEVVVMCERLFAKAQHRIDVEKVVQVACLGRIEESILAALAADGVGRVTLCDALCAGCVYGKGRDVLGTVVENAREILDVWRSGMEVRVVSKVPASLRKSAESQGFDAARRSALLSAKGDVSQTAKTVVSSAVDDAFGGSSQEETGPTYVHVNEQGVLPHFVPDRRTRLIASLGRIGEPEDVMIRTRLWGNVILDPDKCRSCYMCATFCPTGAMRKLFEPDGTTSGVGHLPSMCVKCRTCESICFAGAISISEEVFAVDMGRGMTEVFSMDDQAAAVETRFGSRYEGFGSR